MLLDDIVDYCDKKYATYGDRCGCGTCNHPSGKCTGCCYDCLYEIHFPDRAKSQIPKKVYDCQKMIYHYVCQYSYLYATELLCAFEEEKEYLLDYPYYHILSLGCGGCTDLMAFEHLYNENALSVPISYIGIDINELWRPVNNRISKYCEEHEIKYKTRYLDVFKCFKQQAIGDTNIIVISYLISYLYNTKQIKLIDSFIDDLVKNIISKKKQNQKLLLIINDVNSYKRGRNYYSYFQRKIESYNLSVIRCNYKYFDTGNLYDGQKIGTAYSTSKCVFSIPQRMQEYYHAEKNCKQTIQLLLEVI